ncbi:hypothetical protein ABH944_006298 [Caballeronia udeis]|uniref:Integrase catalytic region n=1 Tax=Caballeronia udeis TaxID=1232866 RepID=A0ABW8MQR8_9BURK
MGRTGGAGIAACTEGHYQVVELSAQNSAMKKSKSLYHGHRFPAEVISFTVRWYFRFQLSLRGIKELLFERGVGAAVPEVPFRSAQPIYQHVDTWPFVAVRAHY